MLYPEDQDVACLTCGWRWYYTSGPEPDAVKPRGSRHGAHYKKRGRAIAPADYDTLSDEMRRSMQVARDAP